MHKILIFVEHEYEDLELHYPKLRMIEAGVQVVIAGPKAQEGYKGKKGYPCQSDISFDQVNVAEYSGLVIPGGYAPDKLRLNSKVLEITREFHQSEKCIAFICHAGWVPISAKIMKGVKCTSYKAVKDDLINAGATWVDEAVVIDRHFISSRHPTDLPKFCPAILQHLEQAKVNFQH